MDFQPNDTIVFQGDSITDASRRRGRKQPNDPAGLGLGYVLHTAAELLHRFPKLELQIFDRGISGNKVYQLADRWDKDCLRLKPNVLSILIGVNDYWHMLNSGYGGTVADYQNDYDLLLEHTRNNLPDVRLVLGEPFLLKAGEFNDSHLEAIRAYQQAAQNLSEKHNAIWVPYQQAFNNALNLAPADYWAPDGVHPTAPGHMLMAKTWLKAVLAE